MSVSRQSLRSLLGSSPNPREHLHKQMSYAIKNRYHGIERGEFRDVNVDEIVNVILYSYQGCECGAG